MIYSTTMLKLFPRTLSRFHTGCLSPSLLVGPQLVRMYGKYAGGGGFRRSGPRISETSVFMQNGSKITELPLVVKKVKDIFEIYRRMDIKQSSSELQPTELETDSFILVYPDKISQEEMETIDGFNRCFNSSSIFRLLETVPRQEVTPLVAAHALRKIIDLENSFEMRNPGSTRETIRGTRRGQDTFLRVAFMTMLLDIVCGSRQPKVILDGLSTVMRDQFPAELATYKERLLEELLVCVSEGIFSVLEVCRAINILSLFYEDRKESLQTADKLWFGIADNQKEINSPEVVTAVFSTLPNLKKSRNVIKKIVEKKALKFCESYKTGDIIEILRVLTEIKYDTVNRAVLGMVSQWLALNIHAVKESEMLAIVYSLTQLNFCDDKLINTMEKIIKVKGCQIQEIDLVSTICAICTHFRVRSPIIVDGASEYLVHNITKMSVPQLYSIAKMYGELDFHPTTGFKFWRELEHALEEKFVQFKPCEIIDLLVSFLYIEKYPLNFVNKLFNPYFLDRVHSQPEHEVLSSTQQLRLFDAGMRLECRGYASQVLHTSSGHRTIHIDHRTRSMADCLFEPLGNVVGDHSRIGTSTVLSSLPLLPHFIVDMMIYPSREAVLLRFGFKTENSSNIAVLINLPEHYDIKQVHLLGPQALRIRHLKAMGFRVLTLRYSTLNEFKDRPHRMEAYIQEKYNLVVKKTK